VAFFS
jgi:aminopeptidase N